VASYLAAAHFAPNERIVRTAAAFGAARFNLRRLCNRYVAAITLETPALSTGSFDPLNCNKLAEALAGEDVYQVQFFSLHALLQIVFVRSIGG